MHLLLLSSVNVVACLLATFCRGSESWLSQVDEELRKHHNGEIRKRSITIYGEIRKRSITIYGEIRKRSIIIYGEIRKKSAPGRIELPLHKEAHQ
jgi:hypothetical protein